MRYAKAAMLSTVVFVLMAPGVVRAERAREPVNATGVRGGIIVHLDCNDGNL